MVGFIAPTNWDTSSQAKAETVDDLLSLGIRAGARPTG
jgi:hypothetical protein